MFLCMGGIGNQEWQECALPGERQLHAALAEERERGGGGGTVRQAGVETWACHPVPAIRPVCIASDHSKKGQSLLDAGRWRLPFL